jgi:hypothetical protein
MELPLWLHGPASVAMMRTCRVRSPPASRSARSTTPSAARSSSRETTEDAAMKPERERELIDAWRGG